MKVAVVGLGLIGGSMAIELRRKHFADEIIGVENDRLNAEAALKMSLVDRIEDLDTAAAESDILVIAVPVGAAVKMLPHVLDIYAREGKDCNRTVIDVCSVKEAMVRSVHYHPMRSRYVSTHPMAGTEYSGPWAAMPGLFDGRACIFCNTEESDNRAVRLIEKLYDALNMSTLRHLRWH